VNREAHRTAFRDWLFGDSASSRREREFIIDNLLVRIHYIIVMIRWTGLAPREFEFLFPGSLTSNFLNGLALTVEPRGAPDDVPRLAAWRLGVLGPPLPRAGRAPFASSGVVKVGGWAEMCSGSEAGSYVRRIDFFVSLNFRLESNKEEDSERVEFHA